MCFKTYLQEDNLSTAEKLDLKEDNFPIFEGTLKTLINQAQNVLEFASKIKS